MVIFIDNATFAKNGSYGEDHLWGMYFQSNKWLVPGMVSMGGVVVIYRRISWN